MRKEILLIAFLVMNLVSEAQQDPQFSQNMFNHMTINPAFAGEQGQWSVSGIYRNQWMGMDGAPETYAINVDAPFRVGHADGGLGLGLMSDKLGMYTNLHLMLNYAYKIQMNFGVLSMGLKAGVMNLKLGKDYYIPDGDDFTQPGNDPALADAEASKMMFDAGVGVFLSGDKFYAGAAVAHLTKPLMKIGETGEFFWPRYLHLTGGYTIGISPRIDIQPSVFFKTDFISSQFSVNANVVYDKTFWGGVSYRYNEAIVFMAGMELKAGLMLGYSYDWNSGKIGKYTGGSHEVSLAYHFGMKIGKKQKLYKSVRFL